MAQRLTTETTATHRVHCIALHCTAQHCIHNYIINYVTGLYRNLQKIYKSKTKSVFTR